MAVDRADYDLVFCTSAGTPLIGHNVLRAFRDALRRASLPESTHFHDLRHAHATNVLKPAVGIKTARLRRRHSGITITGDLYEHVSSQMDQDAAERAAELLRGLQLRVRAVQSQLYMDRAWDEGSARLI